MRLDSLFIILISILFTSNGLSTTVVPFNNLGHLSESSDEIVVVKVLEETNDSLSFRGWNILIEQSFKGILPQNSIINIESMSILNSNNFSIIAGDINLEVGQEYLIFLDQSETGAWRPKTLSYYLYQTIEENGVQYFVPLKESLEIHIEGESNGVFVFRKNAFIHYLNKHINNDFIRTWDDKDIQSDKAVSDFYPSLRAAPAHCTYLMTGSGIGFRWDIFPGSSLEVYCDTEPDNGFAGSHGAVADAVIDLGISYTGINLSNEGVVTNNYNPSCSGGSAVNGNFTSYANSLNGGDNSLIIFNDPCSQIPNLSGCSGTLAVGGSFGSTPFNVWDGVNWYTSTNAYVIVNNGSGACQSASGYTSMLTHEMTHGLGLGHIASSNGSANMNPSCCSPISALDIDCVNYLYAPSGGFALNLVTTVDQISCNGVCDGYISVDNVSNGIAPYTYLWSTGQTSTSINSLCPGSYTVTVTDANSNVGNQTFNIVEPDVLSTTFSITHTTCGLENGSLTIFPSGGTTPYNYLWSNGATNATIINLAAGTYGLTITDDNNCTISDSETINGSTSIVAIASSTDETANNSNDGTASASQSGGIAPINYQWSNGSTSSSISGLSPGDYTVTVSDAAGCFDTETVSVNPFICPTLTIFADVLDISCFGECDGSIIFDNVNNGLPPYTFSWNTGASSSSLTNLCSGTYTLTVTDDNNCSVSKSYSFIEPLEIIPNAGAIGESAIDAFDGEAFCNPSNGEPTLSYNWSNGSSTQNITNLAPGDYTITVTDANNCVASETVNVSEFICPNLTIIDIIQDVSCFGECDASITINDVDEGVAPFTYTWSNGEMQATNANLCAGTYTLTILDSKGCEVVGSFTLEEPDEIISNLSFTNTSCGLDNGIAQIAPTGGSSPYTYVWTTGDNGPGQDGLAAGSYSITITDSNNCTLVETFDILTSTAISLSVTSTNESANSANNGTAICNPTAGTAPYSYLWSNGATSASISNLSPGNYTVTVTDNDNCMAVASVTIDEFVCPILMINYNIDSIHCNGDCNGQIAITNIVNGIAPYTYLWSTADVTSLINGLCQGTYYITITDSVNCSSIDTINITEPNVLNDNLSTTNETSFNSNNGTISCNPMGGTPSYNYLWSNGETSQNITNLSPGSYYLSLTDQNGCLKLDTATIEAYVCPSLNANDTITNILCFNECTGSIQVNPSMGTPPYSFTWENGDTINRIENLCIGNYSLTIVDANNCSIVDSFNVIQPDELSLIISASNESSSGANDGSASVSTTGGTPNYSYLWSNGDTTQSINNLPPNNYSITVTDNNACSTSSSITISAFGCEGQSIIITQTDILCNGMCNGSLQIMAIDSAIAPFSYIWSTGDTTNSIIDLCPNTYSITVTDSNNCQIVGNYQILEPLPLVTTSISTNESSFEANNGIAISTPSGGTLPYSYLWSNGDTTQMVDGLIPGQYTVIIKDYNQCSVQDTIIVSPYICPIIDFYPNFQSISCYETCDGSITIENSLDDNYPLFYLWSNGDSTSSTENLCAGMYSVSITDTFNCSYIDSFTIDQPDVILININALLDITTTNLGAIDITVINPGEYYYNWTGPANYSAASEDISNLTIAGCYHLKVTDTMNNCMGDTIICIQDLTSTFDDKSSKAIGLYPNPTLGQFSLDFNDTNIDHAIITIHDITGRTRSRIEKTNYDKVLNININKFEAGLYLVKIETSKGFYRYKKVVLVDKN